MSDQHEQRLRRMYDELRASGLDEDAAIREVARRNGDSTTTDPRGCVGGAGRGAKFRSYKNMLVDERDDTVATER